MMDWGLNCSEYERGRAMGPLKVIKFDAGLDGNYR